LTRAEDPDPQAADACFEQAAELALAQARQAEALEAQVAAARERSQIVAAEAVAQRVQLALARFAYRQAAIWFREAAGLLPVTREEQALAYRDEATLALYKQGAELGDNGALKEAVKAPARGCRWTGRWPRTTWALRCRRWGKGRAAGGGCGGL
jgi:hypothetical protein